MDIWSMIQDMLKPELAALTIVLYLIGMGLKNASMVQDKWIPLILGGISVLLVLVWTLSTTTITDVQAFFAMLFVVIVQGVLYAGAAVYVNQLLVQAKK